MFGFLSAFKFPIIILLLLSIMGATGYFYYTSTQAKIIQLAKDNATIEANNLQLNQANNQNLNTIDNLQESYQEVQNNFNQLQSEFQVIRSQNNELKIKLSKHELGVLAAAKPKLVEQIINNASKDALRCFELLSGSPLTDKEKGAKNEKEFNSSCPWIFVTP